MVDVNSYIAKGTAVSYLDIPNNDILNNLPINGKMLKVLNSYNKCPKTHIKSLSERLILLNAAMMFSTDNPVEINLSKHIGKKKNYLSYLKNNYDDNIFTLDNQIYDRERISHFFMESESSYPTLKVKNTSQYNSELNKSFGEYWLETLDPCHRPYIETYRELWSKEISNKKETPYFLWLEDNRIQPNVPCVQYLDNATKRAYQLDIIDGVFVKDGHPISTDGLATLVLDEEENIFISEDGDKIRHTSFNYGRPVIFAGEAKFQEGKLAHVANFSGHFCPTRQDLGIFMEYLDNRNCNTSTTEISVWHDNVIHHHSKNNLLQSLFIQKLTR